ncbi:hypothetical protein A2450_00070 [candidate division WWE3 bacterium RIFOXYC2_FULL_40_11]|uniref:Acylphosphatase-like domain-containing protein n=1 Tax=candidate division WWE3 bacterium RIFOXYA2_FULL_46_9 TaxID=1802636 RepID=A0A1F4W171_UNCKA|nr:MAG: hypothetical protein A2264_00130 [candidate division WWE3 bacterium RIFOXYA2_FULL_46_9]OGC64975.1 MAG: hypothetical protein A2326_02980 [candidate division WWE3 bacterium RIFOXYB2_FULL_41_6]OGC67216.1 MAG: hypothetical protein A2450_00070 [candidate division WWE3 bacterium RIFOXYC2_FULL_40_11]OGC70779.1 MAG: hypothetical protein A2602_03035 [candidate division WWE3 bacterium RIFOXYD1_FULL_40_11]HLD51527.1 hypothetical protein [Patescibacteria group bacterium]
MNKENSAKKLKIRIKGKFQRLWADLVLKTKIRLHGMKYEDINYSSLDDAELLVSGDEKSLWKVVKWAKRPTYILKIEHIIFQFVD